MLQFLGNPANMGICVVCFTRDTTGGIGLHRAEIVQYIRPEIIGFVLGSFAAALAAKEFQPQSGSSPVIRFVLGIITGTSALVFLGCPWRMVLRIAGGDLKRGGRIIRLRFWNFYRHTLFQTRLYLGKKHAYFQKSGLCLPPAYARFAPFINLQPRERRFRLQRTDLLLPKRSGFNARTALDFSRYCFYCGHYRPKKPFLHNGSVQGYFPF